MTRIESDEAAVRLARAIVEDVALYNAKAIATGADLSDVIAEGRALYRGRVAERFHPFFEDALMARDLSRLDGPPSASRPVAPQSTPSAPGSAHDAFLVPLPAQRSGAGLGVVVMGLLLLVSALAAWFMLRGG